MDDEVGTAAALPTIGIDQVHEQSDSTTSAPTPASFVLSFSNLTYSINTRPRLMIPTCLRLKNGLGEDPVGTHDKLPDTKILLNDISGEAREGEILAVLGASGSGKSTLIDALANRIAKGSLKGSVTLNGEALESQLLKVISAYVMQEDLLFPMLTVDETLMFSAEFRLPCAISKAEKAARVEALIDQLGLRNAATMLIGDEGHRGLSGGERRRVSIGVGIIHAPILLFLDEPTSGLDSTSAFMVVKVLQQIAQSGSIVIMSIHQPSYRILGILNHLIFLSSGQTVYTGSPTNLPLFFSEFGNPIPENENPTEFVLDLIRELEESSEGSIKSLVEFNRSWQNIRYLQGSNSDRSGLSLKDAITASISKGKLVSGGINHTFSTFANPIWFEITVLMKRSIKNSRRMPRLLVARLVTVLVTGFILATIFWQLDNSPRGVQERLGFTAFAVSTTYYNCVQALLIFLQERYIFMRETAHNVYRRSSYVLSHSIVAIPALIFLSIAFAATTFWPVGLSGGFSGFFFFFVTILASFWTGSSFVTLLSGVVPHIMLGYVVGVALLAYFLLFCGYFISENRIPTYWTWFHYISLVKYPFEGILHNEFDDPNKCFVRGVQMFDNTPLIKTVPVDMKVKLIKTLSDSLGMNLAASTCVTTGVDILRKQGANVLSKWSYIWVTIAWGFLFRILFYFCLLLGSKNKQR